MTVAWNRQRGFSLEMGSARHRASRLIVYSIALDLGGAQRTTSAAVTRSIGNACTSALSRASGRWVRFPPPPPACRRRWGARFVHTGRRHGLQLRLSRCKSSTASRVHGHWQCFRTPFLTASILRLVEPHNQEHHGAHGLPEELGSSQATRLSIVIWSNHGHADAEQPRYAADGSP